jgi:ribosomal protein S18 acetylase RimI-like enzyme
VADLALYSRLGFTTAGVRRAYYSSPMEDALLLQAPLVSQSPL